MASIVLFQPWDRPADNSTAALPCWRIPALAREPNSRHLIVLAEGRYQNGDGCEVPHASTRTSNNKDECGGVHRAIFYRESNDLGSTWGPVQRLAGNSTGCLFDPAVAYTGKGELVVQYGSGGSHTWQQTRVRSSSSSWAAWSAPRLLNSALGANAGLHSPAGGLRLESVAPGRVLFAGYGGSPYSVGAWYSDDKGCTWASSRVGGCSACNMSAGHFVGDVSEPSLAQLATGEIVLSMRVDGQPKRRAAISVDGGRSFNEHAAPRGLRLPDTATGNMGSLLGTAGGALFYSMTLSPKADRTHMTVLRSDDGGQTWPRGRLVYPGPSAYSDLVNLEDAGDSARNRAEGDGGRLGLAYERDIAGCTGPSCSIVYETLSTALPPMPPMPPKPPKPPVPARASAAPLPHLLFFNRTHSLQHIDPRLHIRVQPALKERRVIQPTEPWESWAVFAYNSVVAGDRARPHRLYYDCIEGTGVPPGSDGSNALSHRRVCLAESVDGVVWSKPSLGLFARNGSTANNILLEDSGVSVFLDANPHAPAAERWKMACSNAAYASSDGLRWRKLPWAPIATDDTKPTAYFDPSVGKYVISVRRDVAPGYERAIGRCATSNFSNWQEEVPSGRDGCDVVFRVDAHDPPGLDVYTNAWTPYPSTSSPLVHLFFPSMYHHFTSGGAPAGLGNDGLLDIRMLMSVDNVNVTYADADNARAPFVPLGDSTCGAHQHAPGTPGGWCTPDGPELATTPFDSSATYMASGYVPSADGAEIYLYASGQPFTHGGDGTNQTWRNNTGIRLLRVRRDGFVAIEAPYDFATPPPTLTTVELTVPTTCPPPTTSWGPARSGCAYEFTAERCPKDMPPLNCTRDADCHRIGPHPTCHGRPITCRQRDGVCASACEHCEACYEPRTPIIRGGVQLLVNMVTSVAGYVAIEVLKRGSPVEGHAMAEADRLKGGAVGAVASWQNGRLASLSSLAGERIALRVALVDAKLFSVRLDCDSE